jgi:16S rRNA (guanine1207-N2)-methyltransferase
VTGSTDAQYFDDDPSVASEPLSIDVTLPDTAFTLETDRGVFSRGQLDAGTGLLLRTPIELPRSGHLLDLGCGAGPIALALARRAPEAEVWAIDVNERARQLCIRNAARNDIDNVVVRAPGEVDPSIVFAAIWSNPPIRIGKAALHQLLATWLDRLDEGGAAALVVQKYLGADSLQRWLIEQGWPTTRRASKAGYRILLTHPRNSEQNRR